MPRTLHTLNTALLAAATLLLGCKARAPLAEVESARAPQDFDALLVAEAQLIDGGAQALLIPTNPTGAAGDLRPYDTPVRDQGRRATGAAFAVAAALENMLRQQGQTADLSEEQIIQQSGAAGVRAAADALTRANAIPESDWPYTSSASRVDRGVGRATGLQALDFKGVVRSLTVDRRPVILAVVVNASWAGANRGMIDPFAADTTSFSRTQAVEVSAIGYDENAPGGGYLLFKNSWGESWGDKGFGSLPFAYCQTRHCYAWALTGAALATADTVASPATPNCNTDIALIAQGGSGVCYSPASNPPSCYQYANKAIFYHAAVACPAASTAATVPGSGRAAPPIPTLPGPPMPAGSVSGTAIPQNLGYVQGQPLPCGCLQDGAQCYLTRGAQRFLVGAPAPSCAQTCTDRAAMNNCRY